MLQPSQQELDLKARSRQSVETRVQVLWDYYLELITEVFFGSITIEQALEAANVFFTKYQEKHQKRMAPESLESGSVDCTSAAALCAMFWWLTRNVSPYFFFERDVPKDGVQRSWGHITPKIAHSVAALPSSNQVSRIEVESAYHAVADEIVDSNATFVNYTNRFKRLKPKRVLPARIFNNVDSFLGFQVGRYKTETRKLPKHRHILDKTGHNFEVIHGTVVDPHHLPERVEAMIRLGLAVEGDYRDITQISIAMLGLASEDQKSVTVPVVPAVVRDKKSGEVTTLFHLK